jgi:uncharacterized iron-regulated protein
MTSEKLIGPAHRPDPIAAIARALLGLLVVASVNLPARAASAQMPPPVTGRVVLFGEVHDNAAQHALRLLVFEALLRSGARPALLLEQFDRERQPEIDRARAQTPAPDADRIILAGSGAPASETRLWNWPFYRPLLALALAYDLPIVAANVSRDDARRVIADGLAAHGFDPAVAPEIVQAQAEAIEGSHCGMLDAPQARRMASAQIARDQFMAHMVEVHTQRGVVLLAGNGHVRTDIGVPRWLTPAARTLTESIGMLERDDAASADQERAERSTYDRVIRTPAQARPDPCGAKP